MGEVIKFPKPLIDILTEEQQEEHTEIQVKAIKDLVKFADKHNFDRNDMLRYSAEALMVFSNVANVANLEVGEE